VSFAERRVILLSWRCNSVDGYYRAKNRYKGLFNEIKLKGKSVFMSSVTDCYNSFEKKYGITKRILEQLVNADCQITISTKPTLVLRDIKLLKRISNLKVAFSINTLDDAFRADMDNGSSIEDRLHAIEELYDAGIHTVLFMSPIFPYITEWKKIIDCTKENVCEYWFENLNLRGEYKSNILSYIATHYPDLKEKYEAIYLEKDNAYWDTLADLLNTYCDKLGLDYVNYFYHEKLVKEKVNNSTFPADISKQSCQTLKCISQIHIPDIVAEHEK